MEQSSFSLNKQNQHIESQIVVALERISESFRVLLWNESKENSLSPIQIQILIFLLFHSEDRCKVSYLADEFNMTKATISDSVKVLLSKKMVRKEKDPRDTRSFVLLLTSEGQKVAKKASLFASTIEKPIEKLSQEQKTQMLEGLQRLIYDLNKSGIITIQRMCQTCSFYRPHNDSHYCDFLKKELMANDLRLDCAEHEMHP
ncbi:winged helix-turn-helix transcriptional regulator [bacterium SCSIO 12643]|nr:winged helix-turn-helix transcriptional regulator [bacterium SCSIO 12643]